MNMAKLGTVSAAGNYFHSNGKPRKQRAGGLMRYTLCEFAEMFSEISRRILWLQELPTIFFDSHSSLL